MKKTVMLLSIMFLSAISFAADQNVQPKLDDMGVVSNEDTQDADYKETPRYERKMRDLNKAYDEGALTKTDYIEDKRKIDEREE
ncbi:MAG: hypothetical protein PHW46_03875 [Candidatus Omnitrophica bacterium]|nr:hypothetical protein [Candidatus Omnitrophota bacterium]